MITTETAKVFLIDSEKIESEILSFLLERELKVNVYRFFKLEESLLYLNLRPSILIVDGDLLKCCPKIFDELAKRRKENRKLNLIIYHKNLENYEVPVSSNYEFHNVFIDDNYEDILYLIKYLMDNKVDKEKA